MIFKVLGEFIVDNGGQNTYKKTIYKIHQGPSYGMIGGYKQNLKNQLIIFVKKFETCNDRVR
jgi:hypothetical protein